ncbi:alpha/beta hydrolase-fold protein [Olivibacter sitiensis]|uniref:carboxylesterase family protein n=1 Tax=Olivibacter sitiensis TaxID=376470 RepID=UPI000427FD14|nr:dienelactone hydrolase family protein [Olivibacter sitiensis]
MIRTLKYTLFALFLSFGISHAQDKTVVEAFEAKLFVKGQDTLPYRILYPRDYDAGKSYPVLFVLHGAGERGNNNQSQLVHGAKLFVASDIRNDYPAIVIFPQCPSDSYWSNVHIQTDSLGKRSFHFQKKGKPTKGMKLFIGLLEKTLKEPTTKLDQVYVGGLSMGGMGTYETLRRKPKVFAAAFAICGGDLPSNAKKYKHMPLWIFHGERDDVVPPTFSHDIVAELQHLGAQPKSTFYPEADHNSWDPAFAEPDLLPWLFSNKK